MAHWELLRQIKKNKREQKRQINRYKGKRIIVVEHSFLVCTGFQ